MVKGGLIGALNDAAASSIPRADGAPWLVLRTRTKCEKFVRDQLLARGLEAYVPVTRRTARYVRKIKVYELPLITGYTFVRLPRERRVEALALPYVLGVLRVNGCDSVVSEREMSWLQRVSGVAPETRVEALSLLPGDKIILARGHLAGLEGRIMERHGKHEFAVSLDSIGLQLVIHVHRDMIMLV